MLNLGKNTVFQVFYSQIEAIKAIGFGITTFLNVSLKKELQESSAYWSSTKYQNFQYEHLILTNYYCFFSWIILVYEDKQEVNW